MRQESKIVKKNITEWYQRKGKENKRNSDVWRSAQLEDLCWGFSAPSDLGKECRRWRWQGEKTKMLKVRTYSKVKWKGTS